MEHICGSPLKDLLSVAVRPLQDQRLVDVKLKASCRALKSTSRLVGATPIKREAEMLLAIMKSI